jgi:hypothetical protein
MDLYLASSVCEKKECNGTTSTAETILFHIKLVNHHFSTLTWLFEAKVVAIYNTNVSGLLGVNNIHINKT